jgi:hypothetical protein
MGLGAIFRRLRTIAPRPVTFHVRRPAPRTTDELIALMDRFVDDQPDDPMEWDDFISWGDGNQHVQETRTAMGEFEKLLFSSDPQDRAAYAVEVVRARNRLAALLGRPTRQAPSWVAISDQDAG